MSVLAESSTPDREALVARAGELVPLLRGNTAVTREARRVADDNIAALSEAGLFGLLQPRRWGGLEADFRTHLDVVAKVAEGCASTGWVLGVGQIHGWLAMQFSERAQAEIFAGNPDARVAGVPPPRGTARQVGVGFEISGFWPFGSGCDHSDWILLGAVVEGLPPGTAEMVFLVPINDVEIMDDWNVGGLRGTGSHSVRAERLFVPKHRAVGFAAALSDSGPGRDVNPGPLYRSAAVPAMVLALTGTALGAAEMALGEFIARLPGRQVAYMDDLAQDHWSVTRTQVAEARTKIDIARMLLERVADDIDHWAAAGRDMPLAVRARTRTDASWAVRQCLEAVEVLYLASGGSALAHSNPIQLAQQDIHAVNLHGIMTLETSLDVYGRVLLGQDPGTKAV
ncbi:MAG: acyl-CoA dehydrogenase family protein [Alphaproteobacteria bacterium]|nr:acyl-CoA dehydrogenase family protein [Alphaproteobacteria bacterium]